MGDLYIDTGLSYIGGEYIIVSDPNNPSYFDIAQVQSYNSANGLIRWLLISSTNNMHSINGGTNIDITGVPGTAGAKGEAGDKGEVGETGQKGEIGVGDKGEPGADSTVEGPKGEPGTNGTNGDKGEVGETGQKGEAGQDSNVAGPKGEPGTDGNDGTPGTNGTNGDKGEVGETGDKGAPGETGQKGEAGETGDKGEVGETGSKGEVGETGDKGEVGETGTKGEVGEGDKGEPGAKGDTGAGGGNTYVARADFNSLQNLADVHFADFSGTGAQLTSGTSATFSGFIANFTFSNEVAPPKSVFAYAANTSTNEYILTHLNAGGDDKVYKIKGFSFGAYTSASGEANQVDAGIFSNFGSNASIDIDLQKANFDWQRAGFPNTYEAHVYIVFNF